MLEREPRPESFQECIAETGRITDQPVFQAMRDHLNTSRSAFATGSEEAWGLFCYAALLPDVPPRHSDYDSALPAWAKYKTAQVKNAVQSAMRSHIQPEYLRQPSVKRVQQERYAARYRADAQITRGMADALPSFSLYLAEQWYSSRDATAFQQNGQKKKDFAGAKIPTYETFLFRLKRDQLIGMDTILTEIDYSTPEKLREALRKMHGLRSRYRVFFDRLKSEAHQ